MATEFRLPELGENIESGQISSVFVSPGDTLEKDQPVLEIETDKAAIEVPSSLTGVVEKVLVAAGDEVNVGAVVLLVDEAGAAASAGQAEEPQHEPAPSGTGPSPVEPAAAAATPSEERTAPANVVPFEREEEQNSAPVPSGEPAPAAPSVRRLARELGVEIHLVAGSGPSGRISREDVKAFVKRSLRGGAAPGGAATLPSVELPDFSKWGEVEIAPMSRIRSTIAKNLSASWVGVPHVTQNDLADVTSLEGVRKTYASRAAELGGKLTVTAILLKVVAMGLKVFPKINASIDMNRQEVVFKKYFHIGVAVDTDRGLLVPVIRDVDEKSILDLSIELNEVAERARTRKLTLEEMQGATFTITNLGGIGGTSFTPIVNAPEVAILGVSRTRTEPVWRHDRWEPRKMLPLSLSYDHRLIDGADGARFLRWICDALEKPLITLLEEG